MLSTGVRPLEYAAPCRAPVGTSRPAIVTLSNFQRLRNDGAQWFSPPFAVPARGYIFCLQVHPAGYQGNVGCVSVYLNLMRGDDDDKLVFPVTTMIEVTLLPKVPGHPPHSRM